MRSKAKLVVLCVLGWAGSSAGSDVTSFEAALDKLVTDNNLPGLSVGIVKDQKLVWSRGFGYADLERKIPATASTPYRLASVSKPFAAVLLMQLVEEGKLDLEAPMKDFTIHSWFEPGGGSWAHYPTRYTDKPITVRHVLTHTSQSDPPGEAYAYSGNFFGDLTWVIEHVTGKSYPRALQERILDKLKLKQTLPGQLVPWGQDTARSIAIPYSLKDGEIAPATYPGFGLDPDTDVTPWSLKPAYRLPAESQAARRQLLDDAFTPLYSSKTAAGMISTIEDLARFDVALDRNELIDEKLKRRMFTAARTSDGVVLPYALGWFIQEHEGVQLVWHYGWFEPSVSALYLKVPERGLTLLLLSNSDGLSAGMAWSDLGIHASPYARLFLEHFVSRSPDSD